MNKICKQYISEVKTLFPIMGKNEKKYIEKLKNTVEDYCEEFDIETKDALYENYSTPTQVVQDYFASADTEYLVKKVKFSKFIKITFVVLLALALIGISAYAIILYHDRQTAINELNQIMSDAFSSAVNNLIQ